MSDSSKARPAGQPSTTTPTAAPWDSPQVVIRKIVPYDEPAMIFLRFLIKNGIFGAECHFLMMFVSLFLIKIHFVLENIYVSVYYIVSFVYFVVIVTEIRHKSKLCSNIDTFEDERL